MFTSRKSCWLSHRPDIQQASPTCHLLRRGLEGDSRRETSRPWLPFFAPLLPYSPVFHLPPFCNPWTSLSDQAGTKLSLGVRERASEKGSFCMLHFVWYQQPHMLSLYQKPCEMGRDDKCQESAVFPIVQIIMTSERSRAPGGGSQNV